MRTAARAAATVALTVPFVLAPGSAHAAGATRVDAAGPLTRYDAAIPAGATARVHAVLTPSGRTVVTLVVDGFPADTEYGSHMHQKPCGATGADAGGHYQNVPGSDPALGNPDNEVWLDFTTDAGGHGEASASVAWHPVRDTAHPFGANSVIVHRDETAPGGGAGPRLACLTVPFAP
ncbi:MAG TPA: superoxide dismutase family protein [Frankiaceae bacterium]|nr:superoxide dismutase family protein [Frankiaceae bacterium]